MRRVKKFKLNAEGDIVLRDGTIVQTKGDQGSKGDKGFPGDQGEGSEEGSSQFSPIAIKGNKGDKGDRGDRGRDGEDGEDAWFIPGKDGNVGPPGLIGPPGKDGEDAGETWSIPPVPLNVVFDELPPIPIILARLGSTAPTLATFVGNVEQYTFDSTNDYIIGATEVVHWYREGTNISPHIHWATNGLEEADKYVKWQMEYTIANMDSVDGVGDAFGATTPISVELKIPANTADRTHMFTDLTDIVGTAIKIGNIIVFKLNRIAAVGAAPAADPFCLSVGFHAQKDAIGSSRETTK